jgi:hypothetical protein
LEIVTHDALLDALHVQLAVVVTVTKLLPPAAPNARLSGEIAYEHGAAAWMTVKVWPPTVTVPVRETDSALAAAM